MPSAKPPPPPAPGQQQLRFTSFAPVGFLNAKNVASTFAKADAQSWFARRSSEAEWDAAREGKRRRLMASEEEIAEAAQRAGEGAKVKVGTLVKAPEGGVHNAAAGGEVVASHDPLQKTIIIHPGSRFLRIGRASSLAPVAVPNVIARKLRGFVPAAPTASAKGKGRADPAAPTAVQGHTGFEGIAASAVPVVKTEQGQAGPSTAPPAFGALPALPGALPPVPPAAGGDTTMRPSSLSPLSSARSRSRSTSGHASDDNEDDGATETGSPRKAQQPDSDPLTLKIASLRGDLRARMRAYKLRGQGNGNSQASTYNASVVPQVMEEGFEGDIEWTVGDGEVYVGNQAVRLPDPAASGYTLKHPYDRGGFNMAGYSSAQELLGDVETILVGVMEKELGIRRAELKDYSAILLIPDLYDATYVREMTDLLLKTIGFKQLCLQQESLCATFGAGVSSACVIDIGARTSSITCVEEGLVLPESRMVLDFGGDDITSFLHTLLMRQNFPYKEADLARWYDWIVIEDLKERLVVLSEGDISLNLYDFYVRHPGLATRKYSMRVYEDCILAPYALFAPRVIDFESKRIEQPSLWSKEVDDNIEFGAGGVTNAMRNSTRFLHAPPAGASLALPTSLTAPGAEPSWHSGSPAPPSASATPVVDDPSSAAFSSLPSALPPSALPALPGFGAAGPSPSPAPPAPAAATTPALHQPPANIDVKYEASKLPLDVAVVESILAAGPAEERMKKVAANLIIVGGTGGIHNIGFAVESRIAPALIARAPFLAGIPSYVPCPREIEPENLAWKGISALAKLDCSNDLWVRREEWEMLGMRAVRERGFYWA
ncbi:hypothetical protein JCM10213_003278 [Rhodosporidiobolus nylandii]